MMHALIRGLADVILAPACLGCDGIIRAGDTARLVCRVCRSRLRAVPPPFCQRCGAPLLKTGRSVEAVCPECAHWPDAIHHARSACLLHPPGDRLVHQLKYRGWRALAAPMAERMALTHLPHRDGHAPRYCIAVPTTQGRMRERGYNQAALLASGYASHTGLELVEWLRRTGARGSQTSLQPMARAANVAGAFALTDAAVTPSGTGPATRKVPVEGAHIVLVDDVLTTGATAAECVQVLAAAGACCVSIMTFARALDARRLLQT
jgi:ComF family protein